MSASAPPDPPPSATPPAPSTGVLTIVLLYAVLSGIWILFSDKAVQWLFDDPAAMTIASTLKGWLFVAVTTALLYFLIRRLIGGRQVA